MRPCLLSLNGLDVRGGRALGALLGVVTHLCALVQRLEAAALDRAVMNEHVLAGVIRRDEPEALVAVEPLHCSRGHFWSLRLGALRTRRVPGGNDCEKAGHYFGRTDARPVMPV